MSSKEQYREYNKRLNKEVADLKAELEEKSKNLIWAKSLLSQNNSEILELQQKIADLVHLLRKKSLFYRLFKIRL